VFGWSTPRADHGCPQTLFELSKYSPDLEVAMYLSAHHGRLPVHGDDLFSADLIFPQPKNVLRSDLEHARQRRQHDVTEDDAGRIHTSQSRRYVPWRREQDPDNTVPFDVDPAVGRETLRQRDSRQICAKLL